MIETAQISSDYTSQYSTKCSDCVFQHFLANIELIWCKSDQGTSTIFISNMLSRESKKKIKNESVQHCTVVNDLPGRVESASFHANGF